MNRKNILFIMNSLCFGGAERQTINLINALDKQRFAVGLLCLDNKEDLKESLDIESLYECNCLKRKGKFDVSVLREIHRIVTNHKVDLIVCVTEYSLFYSYIYRAIYRDFSVKIATVTHYTLPMPGVWRSIKRAIYSKVLNQIDQAIFVCKNQEEYWQKNNRIKNSISSVIYNGIDHSFFDLNQLSPAHKNELRVTLGFSNKDIVVGICARLNPEKCHLNFLEALSGTKQSGLSFKGVLIGDGPERVTIERRAEELGLSEDIVITGFVSDVRPYMSICDLLAITSHSEAFSISALEAMAMAKPLIMTDIGGASEQVKERETGFLYNKGRTQDLIRYLILLGNNPEIACNMGAKGREVLMSKFTLKTMVAGYESLFMALCSS